MKARERLLISFVSVIAFTVTAIAGPVPWPPGRVNTRAILQQADLVCRGSVLEIREAAERNGLPRNSRAAMAVLDLIRCYKGSIPAHGVRVDFTLPASPDTYAPAFWLEKGEYALFSLKKQGQDFTFVGSTYGKVKVSRLIKPNTDAGSGLEADLEAGLSDPDPSLVIANLELLMGMGEVHSTAAIRPLIINSNPEVRGTASLALMKLGDYSMLQEVVSFLALNLSDSQKSLLQNPIRNEFEHIKDPKTLAVLHRNLSSPTLLVRSAMVKGMKSIQSPESVAYLIQMLDDKEPEIRFDSVIALAFIEQKTGERWATTIGPDYQKKEPAILQNWKNWWNNEGKYKYPTPPELAKKIASTTVRWLH